jgi:heat shock protein HtpX
MTRFVNNTKTAIFLALLFGLMLLIGAQFGTRGLVMAFIVGLMTNVVAFFFSDRIAIAAMRGQAVDERSAPDLITMVRRLADNAHLPMPRVYVCPQEAPNAFATGRNPRHAAVAVTKGALQLLTYEELEGVIGHELTHVKNRDTLISTVAATIAGAINALGWFAYMGGMGGSRDREGGNPLIMLAMLLLAPIAAALIQMAISRSREYVADAGGASIAGTPLGLIAALQKLDAYSRRIPLQGANPAQNHMFIIQPLGGRGGFTRLFSTHPPTEERIAKLRELA